MDRIILLKCIGSTEPSSFSEICNALNDLSEQPTEKREWAAMFKLLDELAKSGYVEVERDRNGKIESVILTEQGITEVK